MELSLLLLRQVTVMGIMVVAAMLLVKTRILRPEDGRIVSVVATYIVNPVVLFNAFLIEYDAEKLRTLLILIGIGLALQIAAILVLRILRRPLKLDDIDRASIIYSNAGNLVIPLVQAMLGSEAVFYCSAFLVSQNLFLWTHGYVLVSGMKKVSVRRILLTPNIIAIILGIIVFVTGLTLPELITDTAEQISQTNAAINMFAVGIILGGVNYREVFTDLKYYLIDGIRLVVCPLLVILFLYVTKLERYIPDGHTALMILMIGMSASPAMALTNIAAMSGRIDEAKKASALNSMGLIFSIVTMPLMVLIYESIF
ncbi:MAG: AEC family transporter [Lachnospiraceae bacterium]|nr:AEC family transporter [Lachnospiraceae bacterium]